MALLSPFLIAGSLVGGLTVVRDHEKVRQFEKAFDLLEGRNIRFATFNESSGNLVVGYQDRDYQGQDRQMVITPAGEYKDDTIWDAERTALRNQGDHFFQPRYP